MDNDNDNNYHKPLTPLVGSNGANGDRASAAAPVPMPASYILMSHGNGSGDAPEQSLIVRFLWKSVLQWWAVIVPVAILLAVASCAGIWMIFKPVYRASASIQIAGRAPYIVYQIGDQQTAIEAEQFVQTQIELLRGPLVLGPVVSRPEIAELPEISSAVDPVETLRERIKIQMVGNSQLYEVQCESTDPEESALVVNAVVDGYFNLRDQTETKRNQRVVELLEQEKQRRADQVQTLRQRILELGRKVLGEDPFTGTPTPGLASQRPIATVRERFTDAEVQTKILEAQIKAYEESMAAQNLPPVPGALVENAVDQSIEVQGLRATLAEKRSLLQEVAVTAARGKDDPAYQRLAREIESHEKELEDTRTAIRPGVASKVQDMALLQHQDQLVGLKAELKSQLVLQQILRTRYEEQLHDLGDSGDQSLQLEFARAELAREESIFELLAQRVTALQTEMRAPGRVVLMDRASPPKLPVRTIPLRELLLAVLLSFCLPVGIAIAREYRLRRITDTDQLEQLPQLPVLAEIARLPLRTSARRRPDRGTGHALNVFEESIDGLRTCLVLAENHKDMHVLAVASAVSGEGKTSVASQLAVSIARSSGQPTLLIDADMRSPDVHQIFGVDLEPGLCKVLDRQCSIDEAIITSWSEHFHILPAGRIHKNPHKLVGGGAFGKLMDELRQRYTYIVVDTPPILAASESLVITKEADGTVICAMREHSREAQLRLAYNRLKVAGGHPVGVVLNAVPMSRYAFTYGSYAYSGQ